MERSPRRGRYSCSSACCSPPAFSPAAASAREASRGVRLSLERRTLALSRPFANANGTVRERELAIVTLTDDDGVQGHGEAAPLEPYDGVSFERVWAALESYRPVLGDSRGLNGAQLVDACRQVADLPAALAAI